MVRAEPRGTRFRSILGSLLYYYYVGLLVSSLYNLDSIGLRLGTVCLVDDWLS